MSPQNSVSTSRLCGRIIPSVSLHPATLYSLWFENSHRFALEAARTECVLPVSVCQCVCLRAGHTDELTHHVNCMSRSVCLDRSVCLVYLSLSVCVPVGKNTRMNAPTVWGGHASAMSIIESTHETTKPWKDMYT